MSDHLHHILHSQQFNVGLLRELFQRTDEMRAYWPNSRGNLRRRHAGLVMASYFAEESTRTDMSFWHAATALGMEVKSTVAPQMSSFTKNESLADELRIILGYEPDVLVMRHKENSASELAARLSDEYGYGVPVINGGDGTNQHPSQSLLDLYTIEQHLAVLSGITVVIVGDVRHGRTAKSLAYLVGKYKNNRIIFVAPDEVQIEADDGLLVYLREHGVVVVQSSSLAWALPQADVVYMLRTQNERIKDPVLRERLKELSADYRFGLEQLTLISDSCIVMHPLPRNEELSPEVDEDGRCIYFKQAAYGKPLRAALLDFVLSS